MAAQPAPVRRTAKFEARRSAILDAASEQINRVGVRGMTLTAVARTLGIDTSSVTYYYRRKDDLAAACLERTLEYLRSTVADALTQESERERVAALLAAVLDLHRRQREPGVSQLAVLSDLDSLDEEARAPLTALYRAIFVSVRAMFAARPRHAAGVRAALLLGIVHWMPAWIGEYLTLDFDRVAAEVLDVFGDGVGGEEAVLPPLLGEAEVEDAENRFVVAATELINRHGYHGASVDRIAAHLGVSVGSFYHHLDNKDDLVVACFNRSFSLVERAFVLAGGEGAERRLSSILAALFQLQLAAKTPLLRSGAYQALPPALRVDALTRFGRLTRHIAGVIADGIAAGALRPCDPQVPAHCLMAMVLAAVDLRSRSGEADAVLAELRAIARDGAMR